MYTLHITQTFRLLCYCTHVLERRTTNVINCGIHSRVALYTGPSHEMGEGLAYTVRTCVALPQVFMGYQ